MQRIPSRHISTTITSLSRETTRILVCPGQGHFNTTTLSLLSKHQKNPIIQSILQETDATLPKLQLSKYITDPSSTFDPNSATFKNLQSKTSIQQPMLILTSYITNQLNKTNYGLNLLDRTDIILGHSLGEITALVLQDVIAFNKGLKLAYNRGLLMESVIEQTGKKWGMFVLLFQPIHYKSVIDTLTFDGIHISNYNGYQQVVVSGVKDDVLSKLNELKRKMMDTQKIRIRVMDLGVTIPFHHPVLEPVKDELRNVFAKVVKEDQLRIPVLSDLNSELVEKDTWKQVENIIDVTSRPVQFLNCLEWINENKGNDSKEVQFVNFGKATQGIIGKFYDDFVKLNKLEKKPEFKNLLVSDDTGELLNLFK